LTNIHHSIKGKHTLIWVDV